MMKRLVFCAALLTPGLLAACGGNVVLDGAGGAGASGGTASGGGTSSTVDGTGGSTTTPTGTGGGSGCFNPPTALMACGSSSGGAGASCEFDFCDSQNNVWAARCTGTTCQCALNGQVLCTCALDTPGDICSGAPDCCLVPSH